MGNIIIGTAGHIDHGKTTLIKALTGRETDTLSEEKKRGISINLGFTYFDLPSGRRAGIVDVPGHEKFIKNMLAGASGVDVVLLVISAAEGIMPQTKEHMDILSYLKIKKGIIVLTKSDTVDSDLKELVKEDILESISDTFMSGAEIIEVDSITGTGINELAEKVDELCTSVEVRNSSIPPRMNIDRTFSVKGFGTVVTGTLLEGKILKGDTVEIFPRRLVTKVRSIQVHEESVEEASAGQRVALNLANISADSIERGDVLSAQSSLNETMMLDVKISLLPTSGRDLENWDRLRLYIGTREVMCRFVPLGQEEVKAGEEVYAQLRLEESVVVKNGDNFVIRYYSPMETIGGGVILDVSPKKHKRSEENLLENLAIKEKGDISDVILQIVGKNTNSDKKSITSEVGISENEVAEVLNKLVEERKVIQINNSLLHCDMYAKYSDSATELLNEFHKKNSLKLGMPKEELRSKLNTSLSNKDFDVLLGRFVDEKVIKIDSNIVSTYDFEIVFTEQQQKIRKLMLDSLKKGGFTPPPIIEITDGKKDYIDVLECLCYKEVVKLDEQTVIHAEVYEDAYKKIVDFINENGEITLADFRDMTNGSRKYSMLILEDFDKKKITRRVENKRVLW